MDAWEQRLKQFVNQLKMLELDPLSSDVSPFRHNRIEARNNFISHKNIRIHLHEKSN